MRILGVVPARGGSKSVPRKNIAPLAGVPLIGYTIQAARAAKRLARCIVSTDDEEIAETARRLGADVPFLRPAQLSTDAALSLPVLQHAMEQAEAADGPYDAVMMLQPTSPLRASSDIDTAAELLERSGADSVVSVVDVGGWHPARMKRVLEGGVLVNYADPDGPEDMRPRQALPPVYIRNGAIYLSRRTVIVAGAMVGKDCRAYIMPAERSINVDGPADLVAAGYWLKGR